MKKAKRIFTILVALIVFISSMAASDITVKAAEETQETDYKSISEPNWYGGAYSTNNPFAWSNQYYGQCTWYAWGRAYELTVRETLQNGIMPQKMQDVPSAVLQRQIQSQYLEQVQDMDMLDMWKR